MEQLSKRKVLCMFEANFGTLLSIIADICRVLFKRWLLLRPRLRLRNEEDGGCLIPISEAQEVAEAGP